MATKRVTLKGTVNWCKPWPGQIDRAFEDEENGRGGNWNTKFKPDEESTKVYKALGAKAKFDNDGFLTLRRYERHPTLGELGPVLVKGVDEGTLIGNGSTVEVDLDIYDYEFKGRPGRGMRWVGIEVYDLVKYEKPDTAKPAVGVPVV